MSAESSWLEREQKLLARISELEVALSLEREMRARREREWLEFTRLFASMDIQGAPEAPEFLAAPEELEDSVAAVTRAESEQPSAISNSEADLLATRKRERAYAVRRDLRAYLMAEQVRGIDILEVGVVAEGWTGPVVVRLVDDRGRPVGTLAADRLRLEGSHAARSVTLIFEEGYEVRGGVRVPFGLPERPGDQRGGSRRIYLPGIDPGPWISAFPELFGPGSIDAKLDDGEHDLMRLRLDLNELLRASTRVGHWRLRALGGVREQTLHDIQIVELNDRGRVLRRLFADSLDIKLRGQGIELLLQGGVQERNGRRAPFLEGRYRIILPKVHLPTWLGANLPGLGADTGPIELPETKAVPLPAQADEDRG